MRVPAREEVESVRDRSVQEKQPSINTFSVTLEQWSPEINVPIRRPCPTLDGLNFQKVLCMARRVGAAVGPTVDGAVIAAA